MENILYLKWKAFGKYWLTMLTSDIESKLAIVRSMLTWRGSPGVIQFVILKMLHISVILFQRIPLSNKIALSSFFTDSFSAPFRKTTKNCNNIESAKLQKMLDYIAIYKNHKITKKFFWQIFSNQNRQQRRFESINKEILYPKAFPLCAVF